MAPASSSAANIDRPLGFDRWRKKLCWRSCVEKTPAQLRPRRNNTFALEHIEEMRSTRIPDAQFCLEESRGRVTNIPRTFNCIILELVELFIASREPLRQLIGIERQHLARP